MLQKTMGVLSDPEKGTVMLSLGFFSGRVAS